MCADRGRDRDRSEERGRSTSRERGGDKDNARLGKRDPSPGSEEEENDDKYSKNVSIFFAFLCVLPG